jgi:hypothetical protein
MGRKRHSKDSIIQTLQNLARRVNKETLTKKDVQAVIPVSSICTHFGSLGNAMEAAGLQRRTASECSHSAERALTHEELFRSILEAETELGHEPGRNEYSAFGKYSITPFKKRFGRWSDVLVHYRKWKAHKGAEVSNTGRGPGHHRQESSEVTPKDRESRATMVPARGASPAQLYGEPIDFRGLRHAPINEQGVVYLFGMVSRELGFYVEALQQGFPDCEGKYLYDPTKNLWAKARIEFEFKASNFKEHGHDPKQCDFIVCWINDWQDCPITVIELRQEIVKLPDV